MRRSTLLCLLFFGLLVAATVAYFPRTSNSQDTNVYQSIAERAGEVRAGTRETVDSEYPPLATSMFYMIKTAGGSAPFALSWSVFLCAAILAGALFLLRVTNGEEAAVFLGVLAASIALLHGELLFARFDILVALLLFLGWRCHVHERYGFAGFFIALAAGLKMLPVVVLPLFFIATARKKILPHLAGILSGFGIAFGGPLLLMGAGEFIRELQYFLQYHSGRGFQVESTVSGIEMFWKHLHGTVSKLDFHALALHNSDIDPQLAWVLAGLLVAALAGLYALAWYTRKKADAWSPIVLSSLLLMLGLSPILSPQYVVWIVPLLLAYCWFAGRKTEKMNARIMALALLSIALGLLTQWIYPLHYSEFADQSSIILTLILVLRNALFFVLPILLLSPLFPYDLIGGASKLTGKKFAAYTLIFASVVSLTVTAFWLSTPVIREVQYSFVGSPEVMQGTFPLSMDSRGASMYVDFIIDMPQVSAGYFILKPDDCIETLQINGKEFTDNVPYCDYASGRVYNLGSHLHPGINSVGVLVTDSGGLVGFNAQNGMVNTLTVILGLIILLVTLWYGTVLLAAWQVRGLALAPYYVFTAGAVIRILYMLTTPYTERAHDSGAHIDYVRAMVQHFVIPHAEDGWEFHQAPLYYGIVAAWAKLIALFGLPFDTALIHARVFALLLSIGCLVLTVCMANMLFERAQSVQKTLFVGIVAFFPSLIFLASQVTNETLYCFLGFAALTFLIRWWKDGHLSDFYITCIIIAIGFLTKLSALTLLPCLALCLLLRPPVSLRRTIKHGFFALLIMTFVAGWLPVVRLVMEKDRDRILTIGNEGMSGDLATDRLPKRFLTFHPRTILQHPFNNPWEASTKSLSFWDYFYRSAFFGEYGFEYVQQLASLILGLGMMLVLLGLLGVIDDLRTKPSAPLLCITVFSLAASVAYAWKFPYSPNQDFRFAVLLVIPFAYFAVKALGSISGKLEKLMAVIMSIFCLLCGIFLCSLI